MLPEISQLHFNSTLPYNDVSFSAADLFKCRTYGCNHSQSAAFIRPGVICYTTDAAAAGAATAARAEAAAAAVGGAAADRIRRNVCRLVATTCHLSAATAIRPIERGRWPRKLGHRSANRRQQLIDQCIILSITWHSLFSFHVFNTKINYCTIQPIIKFKFNLGYITHPFILYFVECLRGNNFKPAPKNLQAVMICLAFLKLMDV